MRDDGRQSRRGAPAGRRLGAPAGVYAGALLVALVLMVSLAACGAAGAASAQGHTAGASAGWATPGARRPGGPAQDETTLIARLRAAGMTVSQMGQAREQFLTVTADVLIVNGERVEVFTYPNHDAADADALTIAPDACMARTSGGVVDLEWSHTPHFYESGALIVLYLGTTHSLQTLLTQLLGPQFAGKP